MINIIKSKIKLFIFFIASLVYRTRIGKFEIQKNRTSEYLTNAGFELLHKKNSKMFDNTKYDLCFNQIWRKN